MACRHEVDSGGSQHLPTYGQWHCGHAINRAALYNLAWLSSLSAAGCKVPAINASTAWLGSQQGCLSGDGLQHKCSQNAELSCPAGLVKCDLQTLAAPCQACKVQHHPEHCSSRAKAGKQRQSASCSLMQPHAATQEERPGISCGCCSKELH